MFCISFLNRIFFVIRYYYIHRLQRKKEGNEERKKERKRAHNLKSAHLWLLLIVIQLTYTRMTFLALLDECSTDVLGN